MGRLFWKIFLWFWSAMLLMGFSIAWAISTLIDVSDLDSKQQQLKRLLRTRVETLGQIIEFNGEQAARNFLIRSQLKQHTKFNFKRDELELHPPPRKDFRPQLDIYVTNDSGNDILNRTLPEWSILLIDTHIQSAHPMDQGNPESTEIQRHDHKLFMIKTVTSEQGLPFTITARLKMPDKPAIRLYHLVPFGLGRIYERHPQLIQLRLGLALLLSSLFCFALSWYLVKPMKLLRSASRSIAAGQLETRVAMSIGKRGDELEALGHDFDYMADRLQTLVSNQQNLLNDVSHELRSPLTRLQLAIGLAQQKNITDLSEELERIELECQRLNELLEQVLTLARFNHQLSEQDQEAVDLVQLLEEITNDAEFEAARQTKHVAFHHNKPCTLNANRNLLHRAIENIVRNAVKYTADNTAVKITLEVPKHIESRLISIQICDEGPGVPEFQLTRLFEPFFRVASARDRHSGGYGLGLAIAKRAILAHHGEIKAMNKPEGGLCVRIDLPYDNRFS